VSDAHLGTTKHTCRGRLTRWCWACRGDIRSGETYFRHGVVSDGRRFSVVEHPECGAEVDRLRAAGYGNNDEFGEGCIGGWYFNDEDLSPEYVAWRESRNAENAGGEP